MTAEDLADSILPTWPWFWWVAMLAGLIIVLAVFVRSTRDD